jgi:hypothetical protein
MKLGQMEATCCCFCCPYVPLLFEMVLPLLLLYGLGSLKTLFEPALVPAGWTDVPVGLSNDAQQPQEQYYHSAAPISFNFMNGGSSGTAPMTRPMTILDLILNYEATGPQADSGYVCRKIGLAGADGVSAADLTNFQQWVDNELLGYTKMKSACATTFGADPDFGSGYYQLTNSNFGTTSMVFQSETQLQSWIEGDKYGTFSPACVDNKNASSTFRPGQNGPYCSTECSACTAFSSDCQPEINLAIVFDKVSKDGAGGQADWSFSIRLNTTFGGYLDLGTSSSPTDDISARPDPGKAQAYANSGFLTLQSLAQRYIVNKKNGPGSASSSDADGAGRLKLFTNMYETGYFASKLYDSSHPTGKQLMKVVVDSTERGDKVVTPEESACQKAVLDYVTNSETYFPNVVNFVALPTFAYSYNTFYNVTATFLPMVFILLFLLSVFLTHSALLVEKETKMREMLKIMGVSSNSLMTSWFMMYGFINFFVAIVYALYTHAAVFVNTETLILFFFYFFFLMSIVSWAYFVTAFFSKSMTGGIAGTIAFLGGWIAVQAINDATTQGTRAAFCLLPAAAFTLGVQQISLFEQKDLGITMDNANVTQQNFSFATALGMLFFDTVLYAFLGWYFDQVLPQEFGTRQPFYFPLLPSYWCGQSKSTPVDKQRLSSANSGEYHHELELGARDGPDDTQNGNFEPVADIIKKQEQENTCVVIRNLRKVFVTPDGDKVAVEKLNLTMYRVRSHVRYYSPIQYLTSLFGAIHTGSNLCAARPQWGWQDHDNLHALRAD